MEIFQRKMNGDKKHEVESICFHLNKLFNTKQGTLKHMPEYGLPDFGYVCRGMPDSLAGLTKAISDLIRRYEPRLKLINIEERFITESEYLFKLKIFAMTTDGNEIVLETTGNQQGFNVQKLL